MLRYKVDRMRNTAIMVIDDDREVGQALTAMLRQLWHGVGTPGGRRRAERAQELQPTVVLDVCRRV
jgi:DNA-binding NtrC family response regulator